MKRLFAGALGLALFAIATCSPAAFAQGYDRGSTRGSDSRIDVSYFYENLGNDGEWFPQPTYGWCWTPYDVDADWRPYSDGRWEYTDYGWSWASNESFGWATYHYGRWFFDDTYGWAWVPGTEWAPAWVAWRNGDDWVGWAPLPPSAGWDAAGGLSYAEANMIPSQEWCFVPRQHVFDMSLHLQVTSVGRNVTLLQRSRDVTRFESRSGRPANIGLDIAQLEITLGRRVPRRQIVDVDSPSRGGGRPVANGVGFFRPRVRPGPATEVPPTALTQRRDAIPDVVMQRQRVDRQRKLESDLNAEHARLARDQQNELRSQKAGAAVEEARRRHAAEQQAFDAHAAQQRQVLNQRLQKQVVRPDKARAPAKQDQVRGNDKKNDKGDDKGKGRDKRER